MTIRIATVALVVGVACMTISAPARAQRDVMAQCRTLYEQALKGGTTAADKPAIPLAKAAPEKSEADKSADPLHGKSWTEFAAGCRAYYLNQSDQPAASTGQRAKTAPKSKPSGG